MKMKAGLLGLVLMAGTAFADSRDVVREKYDELIDPAVVAMRKTLEYDFVVQVADGEPLSLITRNIGHCSATVLKNVEIDGVNEQLLITNHHCVKAPKLAKAGKLPVAHLRSAEYSIVTNSEDKFEEDDTKLQVWAVDEDMDVAIVRTVGGSNLPVAPLTNGCKPMRRGTPLITTGFPHGRQRQTVEGIVTVDDYMDNRLPYPKTVFSTSLMVDKGQSGSSAISFTVENDEVSFCMPGLVYASNPNDDTTRLVTPVRNLDVLFSGRDVPSQKPDLNRDVSEEDLLSLIEASPNYFDAWGYRSVFSQSENGYSMLLHRMLGANASYDDEYVQIDFTLNKGVDISDVKVCTDECASFEFNEKDVLRYMTKLINNYVELNKYRNAVRNVNATTEETQWLTYLDKLTDENVGMIQYEVGNFISSLYKAGAVSKDYFAW